MSAIPTPTSTEICTSKNIEAFCSRFVSLNMNLSPASGPTIDAALLGEIDDYTDLSFKITNYLKTIGIPILNASLWVVASVSVDKSSSGIITNVRLIDSVWMEFSSTYIAAGPADGFYDFYIGKEYYNVTGVPIDKWDGVPRNVLVDRNFLLRYYSELNTGEMYINTQGRPEYVEDITPEDFVKNHSPGLPNPRVEFGEFYYTAKELFEFSKFNTVRNAGGIDGIFNDSGTYFDVLSAIGSRFGKLFVANTIWGTQYINIDSGYGTKEKLTSNGIAVPNSAISSSVSKDYSAGYSTEYQLITRAPGRYRREQQEEVSQTTNNYYNYVNPSGIFQSGYVNLNRKMAYSSLYNVRAMAWKIVKDHPIFYELGAAYAIKEYGIVIDEGVSELYDMEHLSGYTWYKEAEYALRGEDFLANAETALFGGGGLQDIELDEAIIAWENDGRFWYATEAREGSGGDKRITQQGDAANNFYPETFGFENFGTARKPMGSRSWTIDGVASLSFCSGYTASRDFGYMADGAGDSIGNKIGVDGGHGFILADYGPIPFPSVSIEANLNGVENFIDMSNSTLAKGGTQFGGVAAVNYSTLLTRAFNAFNDVVSTINSQGSKRSGGATKAYWTGVKDLELMYTENDSVLDENGKRKMASELTEDEQRETINEKVGVSRREHTQNCRSTFLTPPDSNAYRLNRHLFHKVTTLSWYEGLLYNQEQSAKVLWRENGTNYAKNFNFGFSCGQPYSVPFIETISFTLVNELYTLTEAQMRYLESLSITINDGKMTAKYAFSEKSSTPDFRGMDAAKVALQNVIR